MSYLLIIKFKDFQIPKIICIGQQCITGYQPSKCSSLCVLNSNGGGSFNFDHGTVQSRNFQKLNETHQHLVIVVGTISDGNFFGGDGGKRYTPSTLLGSRSGACARFHVAGQQRLRALPFKMSHAPFARAKKSAKTAGSSRR